MSSEVIAVEESDPNDSDDGAVDDLVKGRSRAKWRELL